MKKLLKVWVGVVGMALVACTPGGSSSSSSSSSSSGGGGTSAAGSSSMMAGSSGNAGSSGGGSSSGGQGSSAAGSSNGGGGSSYVPTVGQATMAASHGTAVSGNLRPFGVTPDSTQATTDWLGQEVTRVNGFWTGTSGGPVQSLGLVVTGRVAPGSYPINNGHALNLVTLGQGNADGGYLWWMSDRGGGAGITVTAADAGLAYTTGTLQMVPDPTVPTQERGTGTFSLTVTGTLQGF